MSGRLFGLFAACTVALALAGCAGAPQEDVDFANQAGMGLPGDAGATGLGPLGGVASAQLPPGVAPGSQEDLQYTVGDTVHFAFDSSVINSVSETTLQGQAAWLDQYPQLNVTIEGHADERGTREYNLALGERRATAVKNYLTALGVDPNRMLIVSYGEERPIDPGNTEEAYAKNRRGTTVVQRLY
jgi:peptidoglycan-associated lipoprotein